MALQVKPRQHKDERVYRLAVVIDHGKDKKTGKSNREYIYPKVAEYHTYGDLADFFSRRGSRHHHASALHNSFNYFSFETHLLTDSFPVSI
jgi:hypothetical protein